MFQVVQQKDQILLAQRLKEKKMFFKWDFKEVRKTCGFQGRASCWDVFHLQCDHKIIYLSLSHPFLLKWPHKMGCAVVSTISYLASLSLPLYPLFILMNTDWPRVESHQWLPSEISPHRWDRDFSSGAPMCLLGRRGKGRDLDDLLLGSELCL